MVYTQVAAYSFFPISTLYSVSTTTLENTLTDSKGRNQVQGVHGKSSGENLLCCACKTFEPLGDNEMSNPLLPFL